MFYSSAPSEFDKRGSHIGHTPSQQHRLPSLQTVHDAFTSLDVLGSLRRSVALQRRAGARCARDWQFTSAVRMLTLAWYLTFQDIFLPDGPTRVPSSRFFRGGALLGITVSSYVAIAALLLDAFLFLRILVRFNHGRIGRIPLWIHVLDWHAGIRVVSVLSRWISAGSLHMELGATLASLCLASVLVGIQYSNIAESANIYSVLCNSLLSLARQATDIGHFQRGLQAMLSVVEKMTAPPPLPAPATLQQILGLALASRAAYLERSLLSLGMLCCMFTVVMVSRSIPRLQTPNSLSTITNSARAGIVSMFVRMALSFCIPAIYAYKCMLSKKVTDALNDAVFGVMNLDGDTCAARTAAGLDATALVHTTGNPAGMMLFRVVGFASFTILVMPMVIEIYKWVGLLADLAKRYEFTAGNDASAIVADIRQLCDKQLEGDPDMSWESCQYTLKIALSSVAVRFEQTEREVAAWRDIAFGLAPAQADAGDELLDSSSATPALDALVQLRCATTLATSGSVSSLDSMSSITSPTSVATSHSNAEGHVRVPTPRRRDDLSSQVRRRIHAIAMREGTGRERQSVLSPTAQASRVTPTSNMQDESIRSRQLTPSSNSLQASELQEDADHIDRVANDPAAVLDSPAFHPNRWINNFALALQCRSFSWEDAAASPLDLLFSNKYGARPKGFGNPGAFQGLPWHQANNRDNARPLMITAHPFTSMYRILLAWGLGMLLLCFVCSAVPLEGSLFLCSLVAPIAFMALFHTTITCVACLHAVYLHGVEVGSALGKTPSEEAGEDSD